MISKVRFPHMDSLMLQLTRMSHRVDVVLGNEMSASVMQVITQTRPGVDKVKPKACIGIV